MDFVVILISLCAPCLCKNGIGHSCVPVEVSRPVPSQGWSNLYISPLSRCSLFLRITWKRIQSRYLISTQILLCSLSKYQPTHQSTDCPTSSFFEGGTILWRMKVEMKKVGHDCDYIWLATLALTQTECGNPSLISVTTANVCAGIWAKHLPNTSLKSHCCAIPTDDCSSHKFLVKLKVTYLVKEFSVFYATWKLITPPQTGCNLSHPESN